MPNYDLKCEKCGEVVEYTLTLEENDELEKAPFTHSDECLGIMKKVWSHTPVHFKGSGWTVKSG